LSSSPDGYAQQTTTIQYQQPPPVAVQQYVTSKFDPGVFP
jgi:hypothetical protein